VVPISITTDEAELTIQQVSRRTGLAESTLRYYERIGLIDAVPRDQSSGHRRYPPDLVAAIESLSCLRGTKMSVHDMRAYVVNMRRGRVAAADQRQLFAGHADRLRGEIARLRLRPARGIPVSTATAQEPRRTDRARPRRHAAGVARRA
jgi:MerR family transcriptional regulator, aldehyde-responsive regulator